MLSDTLLQAILNQDHVVVPCAGSPSTEGSDLVYFDGELSVTVKERDDATWAIETSSRGEGGTDFETNDFPALVIAFARATGRLHPPRSPYGFLTKFVYDMPQRVVVSPAPDGSLVLRWEPTQWLRVRRADLTEALNLAHLLEATPHDLIQSIQSGDGQPLFRSSQDHFAEAKRRGVTPLPIFTSYDDWQTWLATQSKEDTA